MQDYAMTFLTETYLSTNVDDYLIIHFCFLLSTYIYNKSEQEQAGKMRFSHIY